MLSLISSIEYVFLEDCPVWIEFLFKLLSKLEFLSDVRLIEEWKGYFVTGIMLKKVGCTLQKYLQKISRVVWSDVQHVYIAVCILILVMDSNAVSNNLGLFNHFNYENWFKWKDFPNEFFLFVEIDSLDDLRQVQEVFIKELLYLIRLDWL